MAEFGAGFVELVLIGAAAGLTAILLVWGIVSSIVIIQQYEKGVLMRLGKFRKNLGPGLHLVFPFLSRVYRVDTRIQTIDLGRQEVMTKDLSPTVIESMVQYRMEDPEKSLLGYDKYRASLNHIAHSTLRKIILGYELEDLFRKQNEVNQALKGMLKEEFEPMGLVIVRTELKDIDPVGPVKAAIEDRIAAEKERQAMILRADGRRKAILMESEAHRLARKE
ncbi:MAG: SPFH domain-containing protein [Candidatus Thermoplasmatota archaeon]|nr:SPFH domain-containing protein [Candidatus Thermoplasmatota archaeon]